MSTDQSTKPVEYREIERFPGYRFGDDGSVWSCRQRGPGDKLAETWNQIYGSINGNGYRTSTFHICNRLYSVQFHRLILEAFVGPCPDDCEACHADGNRTNNQLDNLRWDTRKSNGIDRVKHGKMPHGSNHSSAKFCEDDIHKIRRLYLDGTSPCEIARRFNVRSTTIDSIIHFKTWRHIPWINQANGNYNIRHGKAKLCAEDIPKIRQLCSEGKGQREIAELFQVNRATISYIASGKTWQHIP